MIKHAFYSSDGSVWVPSPDGTTLTREKKMPKTVAMIPIPGEAGFYAHVEGHVFSIYVRDRHKIARITPRAMRLVVPVDGVVNLYTKVARLDEVILETFVSPRPENHEPFHLDGDETNCHAENLRWRRSDVPEHAFMRYADALTVMRNYVRKLRSQGDSRTKVLALLNVEGGELADLIYAVYQEDGPS